MQNLRTNFQIYKMCCGIQLLEGKQECVYENNRNKSILDSGASQLGSACTVLSMSVRMHGTPRAVAIKVE